MNDGQNPKAPDAAAPGPETSRSLRWRGILTLLVVVALPFIGIVLIWHGRCKKSVLQEITSPDGTMLADQQLTDCGGTMKVASEVRLLDTRTPGKPETVLLLPDQDKLPITWTNNQALLITIPPQAEIALRQPDWHGVSVTLDGGPIAKPKFDLMSP